jgi:hypothetical protein
MHEESGGGEIRTHEAFRPSGFQDRRNQPLCHPSGNVINDRVGSIAALLHPSIALSEITLQLGDGVLEH